MFRYTVQDTDNAFNEMLEAEAELIVEGRTIEGVVLGDDLRYERQKRQLSQKDMEDLFAIKAPTICLYEQGKRKITPWHKIIIERFINGDYDYDIEDYLLEKNPAKGKGVLV
ncbi:helix-turn-helix transcriptional regulator [Bacillus mycoides]|uniref:helix-turn-helix domain-containing protein n=1 Tax=Bacillus mycoides TaxID=1405 RepID=UPI002E1A8D9E|nr:helix-turn-helix transcriptional regulator [Bacillus mycoides]